MFSIHWCPGFSVFPVLGMIQSKENVFIVYDDDFVSYFLLASVNRDSFLMMQYLIYFTRITTHNYDACKHIFQFFFFES